MYKPSIQVAPMASGFKLIGRGPDRADLNQTVYDSVPGFSNVWTLPPAPAPIALHYCRTQAVGEVAQ